MSIHPGTAQAQPKQQLDSNSKSIVGSPNQNSPNDNHEDEAIGERKYSKQQEYSGDGAAVEGWSGVERTNNPISNESRSDFPQTDILSQPQIYDQHQYRSGESDGRNETGRENNYQTNYGTNDAEPIQQNATDIYGQGEFNQIAAPASTIGGEYNPQYDQQSYDPTYPATGYEGQYDQQYNAAYDPSAQQQYEQYPAAEYDSTYVEQQQYDPVVEQQQLQPTPISAPATQFQQPSESPPQQQSQSPTAQQRQAASRKQQPQSGYAEPQPSSGNMDERSRERTEGGGGGSGRASRNGDKSKQVSRPPSAANKPLSK